MAQPGATDAIERLRIDDLLKSRTRVDIKSYEEIMGLSATQPIRDDLPPNSFRFLGLREGRREYHRPA